MNRSMLASILLLTLLALASPLRASAEVTYLTAGALVDTQAGKRIERPVVQIEDDRIVSVTSGGAIPEGAVIIDLGEDMTILPGLADMHTHLTFDAGDFGSDSATIPHGDNAKQFAVYVELGMTPMQAIQSATTVAAESLGWVGDTGAVAPGYYADIIAVNGNPLEDITVLCES